MLLMTGKGAAGIAGGGGAILGVVAGIASLFSGGDEESTNDNAAENGQHVEQSNDEVNGDDRESSYDTVGSELDDVINGNDESETGNDSDAERPVDVVLAPKHDAEDLLRAVQVLSELERLTREQREAVFAGDTADVELFDSSTWRIYLRQLEELAERGRLREGANRTDLGRLNLTRNEQGEWRIVLRGR